MKKLICIILLVLMFLVSGQLQYYTINGTVTKVTDTTVSVVLVNDECYEFYADRTDLKVGDKVEVKMSNHGTDSDPTDDTLEGVRKEQL